MQLDHDLQQRGTILHFVTGDQPLREHPFNVKGRGAMILLGGNFC